MPPSTLELEPPRPEDFDTSREEVEAYEERVEQLTALQARLIVVGGPVGGLLWVFLVEEATVRYGGVLFVPAYMVAGLLAAAVVVGAGGMLLWHLLGGIVPRIRRVRAFRSARSDFRTWWSVAPPELPRGHPPVAPAEVEVPEPGSAAGTDAQRRYLRRLYDHHNTERFDGHLPDDLCVRLSHRMASGRSHVEMWRHPVTGRRYVVELALSEDLMREENDRDRDVAMRHQMAHVAAWLVDGHPDHKAPWKRWARRARVPAEPCLEAEVEERPGRRQRVRRVPPFPTGG